MDQTRAVTKAVADFAAEYLPDRRVCVALSGGPDSLALTAGAVAAGLAVHALVVDHQLQPGSSQTACAAAQYARDLGASAEVLTVTVDGAGGLEAAARDARYGALEAARGDRSVLIGHTVDDQAETVLLGLARGSGPRSIAGMARWRAPWGRPLLGVTRATTHAACQQWGLTPHRDPHNDNPRFTRVRVRREVLPVLDDVLSGGVVAALARTADVLRDDVDLLEQLAAQAYSDSVVDGVLCAETVAAQHPSLRRRVLHRWLTDVGATEPTARVVDAADALVMRWRGQGPVAIGGNETHRLVVVRRAGMLTTDRIGR
ncbi:tRNA(Ile)-lysidine synthase [Gordonia effusa NBRC 100432]|uniref:tRNA(Ile)-lysidine synthase n=1 Tax=Gordonia effusa NBRC 100432 TaxID=1077974 RepID=H0R298_9ACTN|nr:tRNA lysidine(34) synthetase TilS [Gordonia effusa]GAB19199.1 tRNA(Ile)-lysidine synthase [Gordonia effusa NBRC 100432]